MSLSTEASTSKYNEDGLDFCSYCGATLDLVDGTDPGVARNASQWAEQYECENGHTGRYVHHRHPKVNDEFHGACAKQP